MAQAPSPTFAKCKNLLLVHSRSPIVSGVTYPFEASVASPTIPIILRDAKNLGALLKVTQLVTEAVLTFRPIWFSDYKSSRIAEKESSRGMELDMGQEDMKGMSQTSMYIHAIFFPMSS